MSRNYEQELRTRTEWIRELVRSTGADGIVYGNSGGKDSALVGILCKTAVENTVALILPISKRNYEIDRRDGIEVAVKYGIEVREIDLAPVKDAVLAAVGTQTKITDMAGANIGPRLRMISLYAVAASENRIIAGTGNRSEAHMGYFTKWGDGAHDFNPIGDLTVSEIYEFLAYLDAPKAVREKAPSAALFDGQTDESEMGITYAAIDDYLLNGKASDADRAKIESYHAKSAHKRAMPVTFPAK
ncbi:MAG: NAD(+) synthase [Oscillospiraceae bacterium]|jgi:NAD+ synthase|nr:NAD(+) synthase [Oscillospiraceae bacterium]